MIDMALLSVLRRWHFRDGMPIREITHRTGAAYVFTRSGTSWSQQAHVKAIDTGAGDSFGQSVSLSGDGSTLAVGAWLNNSTYSNSDRVGAAYIY